MTAGKAHIGIVGCSAEGAALCYRTICVEGAERLGGYGHPEVSMHTFSLGDYTRALEAGDLAGVGALMLGSAEKLASAGADFLICLDNTIHAALPAILDCSPLPWLPIADAIAEAAKRQGYRRLGLTGTKWLVECDVYDRMSAANDFDLIRPTALEIDAVDRLIMDDLVHGRFTDHGRDAFVKVLAGLKAAGADAAILGCTELPLIVDPATAPLPTLDSTRLLARAALDRAIGR